ncbi:MAG: DUF2203 domain-containing protein [Bdellovibrionaceae bacterium]|nr:DUF2203 domain-containing protein [Pseudobdellovibrionaceae bacterium]
MENNVFLLYGKRTFTLDEARALVPLIRRLTEAASDRADQIINQINVLSGRDSLRVEELEAEIDGIIEGWRVKIEKLGAIPKGLWIVDFDSGDGFFCWKYPEPDILYRHGYQDGFSKRVALQDELFQ